MRKPTEFTRAPHGSKQRCTAPDADPEPWYAPDVAPILHLRDLQAPPQPSPAGLVPPRRFASKRFSDFVPNHPSQAAAKARVEAFVAEVGALHGRRFWRRRPTLGRGLYLDGGFGVGKTHLLAAAFDASAVAPKRYLSFQELVYLIGVLGMEHARVVLGDARLLCIDEFELDDPGNTLIVRSFLLAVFERGGLVITTSNTAPAAQGAGRFDAASFQREIQSLAERFEVVPLDGDDVRNRVRSGAWCTAGELVARAGREPAPEPHVLARWHELRSVLEGMHPSRYQGLLSQIGTLYLDGIERIPTQSDALRFVHFVDKLYDLNVALRASSSIALADLFDPSYRDSGYAKKHERCLSRLGELLAEVSPMADAGHGRIVVAR